MDEPVKICLIVPCYNEAARIDIDAFRRDAAGLYRLIFVNDGSTDDTHGLLIRNLEENWTVLDLEANTGKAEAVRTGMLHLQQQDYFAMVDWVGFWDADLATPLGEVYKFIAYSDVFFQDSDVIVGSRIYKMGTDIKRGTLRHYLGRIFITVVDTLFRIGCYDTQCGAKLFKAKVIPALFENPFISRWIFDVELLLRLKKLGVDMIEYPVSKWRDVEGSKLVLRRTVMRVIMDIWRIYRKYGRCI